jgi:hypothetical protein
MKPIKINRNKKKKTGRKVAAVCACGVVAVAALNLFTLDIGGLGGEWGLPSLINQEDNGTDNNQAPDTPNVSDVDEVPEPTETPPPTLPIIVDPLQPIRVVGDVIMHGEDEVTIDELRDIVLEQSQPGLIWELRGERAILAVIDEVRLLLRDMDAEFRETSG